MTDAIDTTDVAANCLGVDVPHSPYLNETRIDRINGARYEGQEIKGALHVVREGDHVLELGAGLGIVGSVVAKNCKPARMISFEGNAALIPHIEKLYAMNGLGDVISVRNQVLISAADRPESLPFHVHKSYLGSSLNPTAVRNKETVDVGTAAYDEVHQDLKPNVILMDIEGGELEFLEHASLDGVRAIVIEFHPGAYEIAGMRRCKTILRGAGFAPIEGFSSRTVWVAERIEK